MFRKKILLAALALPVVTAYADGQVNFNSQPRYEASLTFLALKPAANNFNYTIYNKELPAQTPTWKEIELKPRYGFAFAFGVRYFPVENSDVDFNWLHMINSKTEDVHAPSSSYFLGPDYVIGPDAIPIRNADTSGTFKWDVLNLMFGHTVNFDRHFNMRFFGGLSNAYLREQLNTTYSGSVLVAPTGNFSNRQMITANFTGIGPRVGAELNCDADYGFGFNASAAFSALYGSTYSKTAYFSMSPILTATYDQLSNYQTIADVNHVQLIPGFDSKVSVTYKYRFQNDMRFNLEAGYMGAVYINAIQQYIPQTLVTPMNTGGIYVATMSHTQSNYSVQGPFLQAALQF